MIDLGCFLGNHFAFRFDSFVDFVCAAVNIPGIKIFHCFAICDVNSSSDSLQMATYFADVYYSELHIHWSSMWMPLRSSTISVKANNQSFGSVYSLGSASVVSASDDTVNRRRPQPPITNQSTPTACIQSASQPAMAGLIGGACFKDSRSQRTPPSPPT